MDFLLDGIRAFTWQQAVMFAVGFTLIWLAIKKQCEPMLLLPMGFGAILVNIPFSGALNQVLPGVGETQGAIQWLFEVGIESSEILPLLLFIGIGAMIDFSPLFQRPIYFVFAAAAHFGIFATIVLACVLGFDWGRGGDRHHRRCRRPYDSGRPGLAVKYMVRCSYRVLLWRWCRSSNRRSFTF